MADVQDKLSLREPPAAGMQADADTHADRLVEELRHPAAQMSFAWIETNAELRRVIEGGDFGAWRVLLHPEQRKYATRSYAGPFRLSGGAGTGKTVVLLHRARMLTAGDIHRAICPSHKPDTKFATLGRRHHCREHIGVAAMYRLARRRQQRHIRCRVRSFEQPGSQHNLGARLGANHHSFQATPGHSQLASVQLDGSWSDTGNVQRRFDGAF